MRLYPGFGNYNSSPNFKASYVLIAKAAAAIWCVSSLVAFLKTLQGWFVEDTGHHNLSYHLYEIQGGSQASCDFIFSDFWFWHPNPEASKGAGCLLKAWAGKTPLSLCLGFSCRGRGNRTYLIEELWLIMFAKCFLIPC